MRIVDLPTSAFIAFFVSFSISILIVITKKIHGSVSYDAIQGIQKNHSNPTPRIGGLALFIAIIAAYFSAHPERQVIFSHLILAGVPAFFFGFLEDCTKKVSVRKRLLATMLSGVIGYILTGFSLTELNIPLVDDLLSVPILSIAFTAFAVAGIANAINIIDGAHGLASGMVAIALIGLSAIAYTVGDLNLAYVGFALAAAVIGFFLVNWPFGRLFLGDGGSYFLGFSLAWIAVLLVERNSSVSSFAAFLICIYPFSEVAFTIYRRIIKRNHPGDADRLHLHSIIMCRYFKKIFLTSRPRGFHNAMTGVVIASMSVPPAVAAYYFHTNTFLLSLFSVLFMFLYLSIYARAVCFRWCLPIRFFTARVKVEVKEGMSL